MAPPRKTRKVNKKFVKVSEQWPNKEVPSAANKRKTKKKKLVDLLGPQWTKEELECFYDSYRTYGKDWRKVSGTVDNRTSDMVEALYNMNQAYLSLPDGAATVAGLIAMMTDYYSNLEGSNSENETDDSPKRTPSKPPPKRWKGKEKTESKASKSQFSGLFSYEPVSSSVSAQSVLKKSLFGDIRPRAVGKRTPRVPVASIQNRDNNRLCSPGTTTRQEDDEGSHGAAIVLSEVSRRGGCLQVPHTPSRDAAIVKNAKLERNSSKAVIFHEGESTLGSGEAEKEVSPDSASYNQGKDMAAVGGKKGPKSEKSNKKRQKGIAGNKSDDNQEACRGTEEHYSSSGKGLNDDGDAKSPWGSASSHNINQQLLYEDDESDALFALHALANVSANILQPASIAEPESLAQGMDANKAIDSNEKQPKPNTLAKDKRKVVCFGHDGGACKKTKTSGEIAALEFNDSTRKPEKGKMHKPTAKVSIKEEKAAFGKGRHVIQASPVSRLARKFVNQVELSPSMSSPTRVVIDVSETLTTGYSGKFQSKRSRKSGIVKAFSKRENWCSETTADKRPPSYPAYSALDLKGNLSHALSNSLFRKWCSFEWFYSAIDYPWFMHNEFVEYLNHTKIGHIPRLTRSEWGLIKGSLGKPRRLSARFLKEERVKLAKYRELVRGHYSSLLTGKLEGLPNDLARPLAVGQRVIACHRNSRELLDGSVLAVNGDRCRVQFDRPELGAEFVLDIDCMPLNPVENIPKALRRRNVHASKFGEQNFVVQNNDWRAGVASRASSSQSLECVGGSSHIATSHQMTTLSKQAKGDDNINSDAHVKATTNEAPVVAQPKIYNPLCILSQIQEREADVRALAELSRALDKKEALLMELMYMNEKFSGKQNEIDNLSDLEHFKNQYVTVLVQLRDANNQIASALLTLRQRNTYDGNPPNPLLRSTDTSGKPLDFLNSSGFDNNHARMGELMENASRKAKIMVDAAVQAMCTTNEGEDPLVKIREVLESLSNHDCGSGSCIPEIRPIPPDSQHANSTYQQGNIISAMFKPSSRHAESPKLCVGSEREVKLPSELISSCISTLLMIQSCTKSQHPPAEVTVILDSALASIQPCCPENAGLYQEIKMCMSIIKKQMLALFPTPPPSLPLSVCCSLPPELPLV